MGKARLGVNPVSLADLLSLALLFIFCRVSMNIPDAGTDCHRRSSRI